MQQTKYNGIVWVGPCDNFYYSKVIQDLCMYHTIIKWYPYPIQITNLLTWNNNGKSNRWLKPFALPSGNPHQYLNNQNPKLEANIHALWNGANAPPFLWLFGDRFSNWNCGDQIFKYNWSVIRFYIGPADFNLGVS